MANTKRDLQVNGRAADHDLEPRTGDGRRRDHGVADLRDLGPWDGALDVVVPLEPDPLHLRQERRRLEVGQRFVFIVLEM